MGFSKDKIKQLMLLMLFAACLVLALMYSAQLAGAISSLVGIAAPFLAGGAIAFVLNLPMRAIEEKLLKNWKSRAKRPIAMVLSFLFVVLVLVLVVLMVVPQLASAIQRLCTQIPIALDNLAALLEALSAQYPQLTDEATLLSELQSYSQDIIDKVLAFLKSGFTSMVSSTIDIASSVVSGTVNSFIALIFSFYVLAQKETLTRQAKRVINAYLPQRAAGFVLDVCSRLYKNFSSFITGQCIEAVILGTLFVIAMSIFRMPYAVMVGVLIAFTALIPVVGAFIGCVVGAFMILIENPMQAVAFVVMFLILQQLENNLIYPHVVGSSVGLPSIWVLVAVTVGGSLFGVPGMVVFIPLVSTFYSLLRDNVAKRTAAKNAAMMDAMRPPVPQPEAMPAPAQQRGQPQTQQGGAEQ